MRYLALLLLAVGCDAELAPTPGVVDVTCNVCALDVESGDVDLIECPGDTDGEWCRYLGCDVACLPTDAVCVRPATCGQRPTQQ